MKKRVHLLSLVKYIALIITLFAIFYAAGRLCSVQTGAATLEEVKNDGYGSLAVAGVSFAIAYLLDRRW